MMHRCATPENIQMKSGLQNRILYLDFPCPSATSLTFLRGGIFLFSLWYVQLLRWILTDHCFCGWAWPGIQSCQLTRACLLQRKHLPCCSECGGFAACNFLMENLWSLVLLLIFFFFFLLLFLSELLTFLPRFAKPCTLSVRTAVDLCQSFTWFAVNVAAFTSPAFTHDVDESPAGFQASCFSRNTHASMPEVPGILPGTWWPVAMGLFMGSLSTRCSVICPSGRSGAFEFP